MNKKECEIAYADLEVCREVMRESIERNGEVINPVSSFDRAMVIFARLIEEHFDNSPLYYAEIEEGKWYWHNKKKEWVKVLNKDVCTSDIPIIETDHEYIEFELNCFYRKQVEE